jgi:hypothetical protein
VSGHFHLCALAAVAAEVPHAYMTDGERFYRWRKSVWGDGKFGAKRNSCVAASPCARYDVQCPCVSFDLCGF